MTEAQILNDGILAIEIFSSAIIFGYCCAGLIVLATKRDRLMTQTIVAKGVLLGMSLKLVGALLKTIELRTWDQIGIFVVIFALRMIIKKVFTRQSLLSKQHAS